jgi:hypothetical protein
MEVGESEIFAVHSITGREFALKKGFRGAGKAAGRKNALTDFASASTGVVHTAAEILEREIAEGIKAAQEIGAKVEIALEKGPDPTHASLLEIIDRFEKDGQEAVSTLASFLRTLARALRTTDPKPEQDDHKS